MKQHAESHDRKARRTSPSFVHSRHRPISPLSSAFGRGTSFVRDISFWLLWNLGDYCIYLELRLNADLQAAGLPPAQSPVSDLPSMPIAYCSQRMMIDTHLSVPGMTIDVSPFIVSKTCAVRSFYHECCCATLTTEGIGSFSRAEDEIGNGWGGEMHISQPCTIQTRKR